MNKQSRFESNYSIMAILWTLCIGSMFVFDPGLKLPFRYAKELFQLPLISLFVCVILLRSTSRTYAFKIPWKSGFLVILPIMLAVTVAWVRAPSMANSANLYLNWIVYLLFIICLKAYFENTGRFQDAVQPLLIAAFIACIYGFLQYFEIDPLFTSRSSHEERRWLVAGFMGQQTLFAGVIGPIFPFAIARIFQTKGYVRWMNLLTAILIFSVTFLTHTRAVLLGYILAVPVVLAILAMKKQRKLFMRATIISLIILLISSGTVLSVPTLKNRMGDALTLSSSSIQARFHYWTCSMEAIRIKPVLGYGLSGFPHAYPPAQIQQRANENHQGYRGPEFVTHPHNEFILITVEGGILLLVCVILSLVALTFSGLKQILKTQNAQMNSFRIAALAAIVIAGVDSVFSFPMHVGTSALVTVIAISIIWTGETHKKLATLKTQKENLS